MFYVAADSDPGNPNPHSWEILDEGPFESFEEAEGWAIQQEREIRDEQDLHPDADISAWFSWTIIELRSVNIERFLTKLQEVSMKRAGYQS
jgi:hypothetical protein